jgi:hypothetical protein
MCARFVGCKVGDTILPTLGYFSSNGTLTPANVTIVGSNFGPASTPLLVTFSSCECSVATGVPWAVVVAVVITVVVAYALHVGHVMHAFASMP